MNKMMYFILSGISQSGLVNWNLIAKIGTRRVHVSAKKLDSHFVFS